ncbi:hypothetical protein IE53DRAFT_383417 [Violaceomyces palustris]|uniref:Uncharacterized protein n=1 Tax=Violaceomyces palustris TaxID=1673888 RepID=A0ACD0P7U3_9BASI|nr:hypothetical protein IE53DRAFT_383417 [Violaceomyces palustris]
MSLETTIASRLLSPNESLESYHQVSTLWAGYGHIYRLKISQEEDDGREGSSSVRPREKKRRYTKILKVISPPPGTDLGTFPQDEEDEGQRGLDEGHLRKMYSYRVESNFYKNFSKYLEKEQEGGHHVGSGGVHVPKLFSSLSQPRRLEDGSKRARKSKEPDSQWLLLEDLSVDYPEFGERRGTLGEGQVLAALDWLAKFHATFWRHESVFVGGTSGGGGRNDGDTCKTSLEHCPSPLLAFRQGWDGEGLWDQGGYSYLSTRMSELGSIDKGSKWGRLGLHADSDLPYAVDFLLNDSRVGMTLVHGDVKSANMAFSSEGGGHGDGGSVQMAMYDFQYVGKGLGVQDVVKFLNTSVPMRMLCGGEGGDGSWSRPSGSSTRCNEGCWDEAKLLQRYKTRLLAELEERIKVSDRVKAAELREEVEKYRGGDVFERQYELALVSWVRFLAGWGWWGNVDWIQGKVERLLSDEKWVGQVLAEWRRRGGRRES